MKMDRSHSSRALIILARVLTIAVACVALGGAVSVGGVRDSASQETQSYKEWISGYRRGPLQMDDGTIRTLDANVGPNPVVVITAIEGDDRKPDEQTAAMFGPEYQVITHGCSVSSEGRVAYFQRRFNDSKGGGYPVISKQDLGSLESLAARLPDDHSQLPPVGRRLVVQVPAGNESLARVYDRANLPEIVLEILRLSNCGITSWAFRFVPESEWQDSTRSDYGAVAMSPDGKQIITVRLNGVDAAINFWDAQSHKPVKTLPYSAMSIPGNFTETAALPRRLMFSPDGLSAIVGDYGDVDVRDSRTWQGVRKLRVDPRDPRLLHPEFTPDGRYLLVESEQSALLVFDTKTWQQHGLLPQIPPDAVAYFPSRDGERAVYVSKTRAIKLWDARKRRDVAQLDDDGRIIDVGFAPDQTLVAVVIAHDNIQATYSTVRNYRIAVWQTHDGKLFHELRPFEEAAYTVGNLSWWPDGKYLMAPISTAPMFGEVGIGLWDVESGRFRGEFTGCAANRFEVFPERQELAEFCGNGSVMLWNGAAAIGQIEGFPAFSSE